MTPDTAMRRLEMSSDLIANLRQEAEELRAKAAQLRDQSERLRAHLTETRTSKAEN